jgi:hypothetical protein
MFNRRSCIVFALVNLGSKLWLILFTTMAQPSLPNKTQDLDSKFVVAGFLVTKIGSFTE